MWRLAQKDEDHELIGMCRDLNCEDPGANPVPAEHMQRTLEVLRQEPVRGRAFVLEIDGKVAGYSLLITFWSNELGGEVCLIDELYVKPKYRGRGHATRLIEGLVRKNSIWDRPWVALELGVSPQNSRARKLYSSLGFLPVRNSYMRILLLKTPLV
jgi:GNAT superfamily N-acetyltransferase